MNDSVGAPVGFWFDDLATRLGRPVVGRAALSADESVDVCIVGGGLTGLWTAYYLAKADPRLRIRVLEKRFAGFGASGRNGGWCSALFPQSASALAERYGRDAAIAMRRAMIGTVDEVGRVLAAESIDAGFSRRGTVTFVRGRVQLAAARAELEETRAFGVDDVRLLGTDTVRSRFTGVSADAATVTADCAGVQPAALVRGLADVVEGLGVRIAEGSEVISWSHGEVRVDSLAGSFTVRAPIVVNATEGYGAAIPQLARRILPLYSLMIATEPLPAAVWKRIGLERGQTFADYRHLIVYGQRTQDDRIAFGGRGARYHLGSAIRPEYDRVERVRQHLVHALTELVPAVAGARITHHWGGPLGVPRDWHASVGLDRATGYAWAGGYVGDGLSTTNLAGRTLADLITGSESPLTTLPWVGHRSPRWESEPLRFAGANLGLVGTGLADLEERVTRRPSVAARLLGPLTGH